nr:hypothetical protein [Tanacetum cinerariifolium]
MDHVSGVNDSDLDVEEDYYKDENIDSEYVSIQRTAFYVTEEPDFDSGPPQDGLEYLRRVRMIDRMSIRGSVMMKKLRFVQDYYIVFLGDQAAKQDSKANTHIGI